MIVIIALLDARLTECANCLCENIDKNKLLKSLQEYHCKEGCVKLHIQSLSRIFKVPEFLVVECVKELVKEEKCLYDKKAQTVLITGLGLLAEEN